MDDSPKAVRWPGSSQDHPGRPAGAFLLLCFSWGCRRGGVDEPHVLLKQPKHPAQGAHEQVSEMMVITRITAALIMAAVPSGCCYTWGASIFRYSFDPHKCSTS